jgi:hypothetical protein
VTSPKSIEELRQIADGRGDILAEAAGITAGYWYAWPSTHIGHELITAGMLIMAGGGNGTPLDSPLRHFSCFSLAWGARSARQKAVVQRGAGRPCDRQV